MPSRGTDQVDAVVDDRGVDLDELDRALGVEQLARREDLLDLLLLGPASSRRRTTSASSSGVG